MFIVRLSSLTQESKSCGKMPSAPLIQYIQGPWARPGSFARKEGTPHGAHTISAKMRSQCRRRVRKTGLDARLQRPAQPFFPRQCKRTFALRENFLRQNVAQRFDQ